MLPITDFLSCTDPLDKFDSLSYHQTQHAKTYVTGLAAASSKTVTGIAREVLPAGSDRALNKFITEYNWDEDELNHERLEELQNHGETRWSKAATLSSTIQCSSEPGRNFPVLDRSMITAKASLFGDKISSMRSILTTKRPIH